MLNDEWEADQSHFHRHAEGAENMQLVVDWLIIYINIRFIQLLNSSFYRSQQAGFNDISINRINLILVELFDVEYAGE